MPQLRSHFTSEKTLECRTYGNKAGQVWVPEGSTAFRYLLSTRLCATLQSNISDCDETLNYWEPTHYLIYGKGFQTWEYSPAYAIRSYAYLLLHAWPAAFHARILQTNKVRAGQLGSNHNWWRGGWVSGTVLWKRQNVLVVKTGLFFEEESFIHYSTNINGATCIW